MRQRLLVTLYFSIAGFFVYMLTILAALSAMDGGSDKWDAGTCATFLTPIILASLFIFLGIRQHKRYAKEHFKKILPSKRDANIFRVLNVFVVIIAGFFILWGLALLIERVEIFMAILCLFFGAFLVYLSIKVHKKFVQ